MHMTDLKFKTSTFCESSGCVAVALNSGTNTGSHMEVEYDPGTDRYYVREEGNPDSPQLEFTPDEWAAFRKGALADQFNL